MKVSMDYRIITEADMPAVMEVILDDFANDVPLLGEAYNTREEDRVMFTKYVGSPGKEGVSIMAVDRETGKIAGCCINGAETKNQYEYDHPHPEFADNLKSNLVFGMFSDMRKKANVFDKYGISTIMDLKLLVVSSSFRGRGLGKELVLRSLKIIKDKGIPMASGDCISLFSTKIFFACGFESEVECVFEDYRFDGYDYKDVFDLKRWLPHYKFTLAIKKVE